jgi:hypothetical protein
MAHPPLAPYLPPCAKRPGLAEPGRFVSGVESASPLVLDVTAAVLFVFVSRLGPMFRGRQQKLAALDTALQENIMRLG